MEKIIILSKNKGIVSKEELVDYAKFIKEHLQVEVEFSTPKLLGTQVTLHDVLEIYIAGKLGEKVVEKFIDVLLDGFIDWAKKRMKKETKSRPKSITIYGPDQKVLKAVTFVEDNKLEDNTNKEKAQPRPPKDSEPFDE
jgi:hypothetical protein